MLDAWYRLTPLELASGVVLGTDPHVPPLQTAPSGLMARAALEATVLSALQRPPCVVSFSGGRDSSAVLALATHVARKKGLPLPVPVSLRFPAYEETDEDLWQDLVIRHLGLRDWTRLVFDDELDDVGPYGLAVLERHGLLWPANLHFHLPVAEQASGGTMLTGFGGDELFHPGWVWRRVNRAITGQVPWDRRDVARLAVAYGPSSLRRKAMRRRLADVPPRPWLRPDAQRRVTTAAVRDLAAEPVRWDVGVDRAWWRTRYRHVIESNLQRIVNAHDVTVRSPLTDPVFLGAIAREGGRTGFATRTEAMQHIVGDLLPEQLHARPSKAVLTEAFWNRHATAFASTWDGTGVDPDLVDIDVLRAMWTMTGPKDSRTFPMLQSAWLAANSAREDIIS